MPRTIGALIRGSVAAVLVSVAAACGGGGTDVTSSPAATETSAPSAGEELAGVAFEVRRDPG